MLMTTGHASVDQASHDGVTPLILAAQQGHTEIVDLLVSVGKAAVNLAGPEGTALSVAIEKGELDIATFLIVNGAEVNAIDHAAGSPVRRAVDKGLLLREQVPLWIGQRVDQLEAGLPEAMPDSVRSLVREYFKPGVLEAMGALEAAADAQEATEEGAQGVQTTGARDEGV